jgi:hypothetical protein
LSNSAPASGQKLHIGCGDARLEGWVNIDLAPYPAVDAVLDVTESLPYSGCAFIFAEHFLEHLTLAQGARFLARCRAALAPEGVLRLTTPNLDWVWATHYHPQTWPTREAAAEDCLRLNRSFYGWGHQFLYNWQLLEIALGAAGFAAVVRCERQHSSHTALRELERHQTYPDEPGLPHVLVAEASRLLAPAARPRLDPGGEYRRDTKMPFHQLQYAALAAVRLVARALRRDKPRPR